MEYFIQYLCLILLVTGCSHDEPKASQMLREMQKYSANAGIKPIIIGWNEAVDSTKFGLAPNLHIDGKTLAQVITSQVAGRDDGQLCSACHNNAEAQGNYGVPAAKNAASPGLKPTDLVSNRPWVGPEGWAVRFVKNPTKPANVKAVVQAWIDNNYK